MICIFFAKLHVLCNLSTGVTIKNKIKICLVACVIRLFAFGGGKVVKCIAGFSMIFFSTQRQSNVELSEVARLVYKTIKLDRSIRQRKHSHTWKPKRMLTIFLRKTVLVGISVYLDLLSQNCPRIC